MDEQKVYMCELCGTHVIAALAHVREVGGKRHAFCSADHLLEWLELEDAAAAKRRHERSPAAQK